MIQQGGRFMAMSRDAVLAADDLKRVCVPVEEWGESVYLRPMTCRDRDRWESLIATEDGKPNIAYFREKLLIFTMCDEQGSLLFRESDIQLLGTKNSIPIARLYDIAAELNDIGVASETEAVVIKN